MKHFTLNSCLLFVLAFAQNAEVIDILVGNVRLPQLASLLNDNQCLELAQVEIKEAYKDESLDAKSCYLVSGARRDENISTVTQNLKNAGYELLLEQDQANSLMQIWQGNGQAPAIVYSVDNSQNVIIFVMVKN
jgi:hypothetical protein